MKCVQCGSDDIVRDVNVFDRGHSDIKYNLTLGVFKRPKAMFFKAARAVVPAKGNVCADCGFVMLSVSKFDAGRLKRMSRAVNQNRVSPS